MSKCRSCDISMFDHIRINRNTGLEEDLCSSCLSVAFSPNFVLTKEYQHSQAHEGLTRIPAEYYDNE